MDAILDRLQGGSLVPVTWMPSDMVCLILTSLVCLDLVKPPKQPDLGFAWRETELRGSNEMKIRPVLFREQSRWVRLYGIDVPNASQKGYSGARLDLEVLLGRAPEVYFEDEDPKKCLRRNASYVQYVWAHGKLLQFELLRDGWAHVNDEGRRGKYGPILVAAEAEAKRFHDGLWASVK